MKGCVPALVTPLGHLDFSQKSSQRTLASDSFSVKLNTAKTTVRSRRELLPRLPGLALVAFERQGAVCPEEAGLELHAWLAIYQAVTLTATAKERTYWTIAAVFLLANSVLLLPAGLLAASSSNDEGQLLVTGLAALGGIICLAWLACQGFAGRESLHWESLLRSIEHQFAGGEFHRSAYRLLRGEETCVPTTAWKCGDWYPEVERLRWARRALPQVAVRLLAVAFLVAWAALIAATWTA